MEGRGGLKQKTWTTKEESLATDRIHGGLWPLLSLHFCDFFFSGKEFWIVFRLGIVFGLF